MPASHRSAAPWQVFRNLSERTPLRTKLITAVLALVIMALAAISIASVVMLRSYVTTQQDSNLETTFTQFATNPRALAILNPGTAYSYGSVTVGIQQPSAQLTPSNPFSLNNQTPLPQLPTTSDWASGSNGVLKTVSSQSGPDTWRVYAGIIGFPGTNSTATLVVAANLGDLGAMTHRVELFDLIVGGAIVIVLAAVGIGVVRANLRPLDDIELTAGQIARGHLDHRIPERDPRTEIGSLGRSLNIMLSQIEAAFRAQRQSEQAAHESEERMRRFIADASHELRTPLTTIRGFAEYYRQRGGVKKDEKPSSRTDRGSTPAANGYAPEDLTPEGLPAGLSAEGLPPEDLDRIMLRLEAEASRMGLLVEDLLQLARLDQQRPLDIAPVDLLQVAADAVQDARMVAPDRPVDLIVAPGAAFIVDGDEPRLRQVLGNLVNNALTHTPPGTAVRVKIASGTLIPPANGRSGAVPGGPARGGEADGGPRVSRPGNRGSVPAVVLDVEDEGPGMTAEQARRAFERFYRADQARSRTSGGTGLGLAIVAGLVAAHGGTVALRTAPGEGADFQVRLPLSPEARAEVADDEEPSEPDEESQATAF